MKMLMYGFATSLAVLASGANADQVLVVDGEEYLLSALMENCQSITGDPAAQISCFSALSQLMDEQSNGGQADEASVTAALDALRAVAEYQDDDTGLSIGGAGCNIHIVYFNNYFHISRRNISSIDLFSAQFNASKLQYDQTVQVQGSQTPLSKGFMESGANAATRGGIALESTQHNFEPRSPRTTLGVYADEVVGQLPATEVAAFDFVLVHPNKSDASADIWNAFEDFVNTCNG
jgi:hypothetical protein